MAKKSAALLGLVVAVAASALTAFAVTQLNDPRRQDRDKAAPPPRALWAAAAPGRIEPKGGEFRIGPQSSGRIVDVVVQLNDRVVAGELLARLDDEELLTRMAAMETENAVRKRERDAETVNRLALDRRNAEDALSNSERAVAKALHEVDRIRTSTKAGSAAADALIAAQDRLAAARNKLLADRDALARLQATQGMPLPTRLEANLSAGRADLSLLETALERLRVRAPAAGSVLQLHAKVGETVAPSIEHPLLVLGDLTALRVRAEVEEREAPKIRIGQKVVVRSDAHPGRDFEGQVVVIAQSLSAPKLGARGPRKPTDVDVLEVQVELAGGGPLLPGMRVDVLFKPDATVATEPSPKASSN
ncbi:MAG TPA: efflux RND transporter periplasmic adaptor subunit [Hyphomicrobiaceae bacterium]|nr:efflux RND transporter periplasmic adaptor subunit [Hyphomicrobiaceae bacterium]